ncbi:HAMP domain-containing sensor histidine kinase [Curtobacterium sp. MCBA15_012]|uniref:sensor histidine kinase n=1 Tax=Curtobacterium sp. MCBA15_012 TaxID=1898738 RepID=UPI0008DD79DF|nr:HAMP domain-containing sensor histidine kinase [Curtobacterium sp. MCBA15_012]WIB00681.1 HAMP domain-containing sensor histidine kinase [Curtobacterium sp. MCBA15_012]
MRSWSIRTRTAVVFALTSMALTAGVLAFVNVSALWSVADQPAFASVRQAPDGQRDDGQRDDGQPDGRGDDGQGHAPSPDRDQAPEQGAVDVHGPTAGAEGDDASVAVGGATIQLVAQAQWQWSAIGVAGSGCIAGVLGWWVSRRMLRPVDRITDRTNRISASTLHERIGLDGPDDELRRLSRTIDQLLDRLEAAFDSQRHFVAQASHELRTPLAVQRAALQIGMPEGDPRLDAVRDELLEQNRRTEHLVESLLVLAEADRGLDGRVERVDLGAVVDDVVTGCSAAADGLDVRVLVSVDAPASLVVPAEPVLTRQLVLNLVDNAVEYNRAGGTVRIALDAAGLTVENTGPVVPSEVVAELTEPFRRCPDSGDRAVRRHSGLGLSIVAAIARAHGWALAIDALAEGGLRIRVGVSST